MYRTIHYKIDSWCYYKDTRKCKYNDKYMCFYHQAILMFHKYMYIHVYVCGFYFIVCSMNKVHYVYLHVPAYIVLVAPVGQGLGISIPFYSWPSFPPLSVYNVRFMSLSSFSTVRRHVVLGRPFLLFPSWVHLSKTLVKYSLLAFLRHDQSISIFIFLVVSKLMSAVSLFRIDFVGYYCWPEYPQDHSEATIMET